MGTVTLESMDLVFDKCRYPSVIVWWNRLRLWLLLLDLFPPIHKYPFSHFLIIRCHCSRFSHQRQKQVRLIYRECLLSTQLWASNELYLKTRSFFSHWFLMVIEWFHTGMIGFRKENRRSIIANRYRRIGTAAWEINGCKNEFLLTIWITGNRRFVFKWEYLCNERTGILVCTLL